MSAEDLPVGWTAERAEDGTWTLRRKAEGGVQVFTGFASRDSIVEMARLFGRMRDRGPAPQPRGGAR